MHTKSDLELDGVTYLVCYEFHIVPGTPPSRDYPGDAASIEIDRVDRVYRYEEDGTLHLFAHQDHQTLYGAAYDRLCELLEKPSVTKSLIEKADLGPEEPSVH